jgi:predicted  nucleic acid-binding Zn-ribbon protein
MRFGRSRVQDRARNSDVETVIDEPSAEIDPSRQLDRTQTHAFGSVDASEDAPPYEPSLFVDSHKITEEEGSGVTQIDASEPDAIDQLRAATDTADARAHDLTAETAAEICRLHEATVDAEQRAGRVISTPRARRRLHDAVTEESDALHMLGFASFDEFATAYAAMPTVEERREDNAETIARIAEILSEIGIDPSADPLEAAREFLAMHEDEMLDDDLRSDGSPDSVAAPVVTPPSTIWAKPPIAGSPLAGTPIEGSLPGPEPDTADTAAADAVADEAAAAAVVEPDVTPDMIAEAEPVPSLAEAASAIEMAAARAEAASAAIEAASAVDDVEPEAETDTWVAAAQLPVAEPAAEAAAGGPERPSDTRDEEIVDRWISAEARAERMHAEVDRAQAELVALLARSAELESTVVARVSERDTAQTDLEMARARVTELEASIAQSDFEHSELDAALAASRDRIAELERVAAEHEQAYARSENDRTETLATIAELETNLAARTAELEAARAAVERLEAQITAHAADLDLTREELETTRNDLETTRNDLETTRNDAAGLRTELETTRRSVSALDEHAESLEAELAQARQKVEGPDARTELEAARQDLSAARTEAATLEARRAETQAALTRDRAELEQLQRSLTTTREMTATARNELSAARNAYEATKAKLESAERAREAITVDAAEILARAEADAANMLERAGRDAEAIRQEARLEHPGQHTDHEAITRLAEQVDRLERKLSKRLRKLDGIAHGEHEPVSDDPAVLDDHAAAILATAEREAAEIRRAARRDRDRFREELVELLGRLAPEAESEDEYY